MEARRAAEEYEQEDLRLRALRAETEREQRCAGEQKEDGYDRRIIGQFQEERWCIQEERAREQQRLRTLRERRERWQSSPPPSFPGDGSPPPSNANPTELLLVMLA